VANVAPVAPGVVRVTLIQNYGIATTIMNRFFYSFTGQMSITAATSLAEAVQGEWNAAMAPLLSTTYTVDTITVTDLSSDTGVQLEFPAGNSGILAAADFLPATVCMVLTGIISRRYRGGKPRWYQTGHHQASLQDNQTFTSGAVGSFQTAINNVAKSAIGVVTTGGTVTNNVNLSLVDGYQWTEYTTSSGKLNYRKDPIYRANAVTDVISSWQARPRTSTQRKRGVN
jgi:hypothetical protein